MDFGRFAADRCRLYPLTRFCEKKLLKWKVRQCKIPASAPRSTREIAFSEIRCLDFYGVLKAHTTTAILQVIEEVTGWTIQHFMLTYQLCAQILQKLITITISFNNAAKPKILSGSGLNRVLNQFTLYKSMHLSTLFVCIKERSYRRVLSQVPLLFEHRCWLLNSCRVPIFRWPYTLAIQGTIFPCNTQAKLQSNRKFW